MAGLKVVELLGIGPGQFCGMMPGDMGAEIISVGSLEPQFYELLMKQTELDRSVFAEYGQLVPKDGPHEWPRFSRTVPAVPKPLGAMSEGVQEALQAWGVDEATVKTVLGN